MTESRNRSLLSLNRETRNEVSAEERLHKVLATAGLGSRRALEERILAGEVRVNGGVAGVGTSVRSGDRVEIDGKAFITVTAEPDDIQILMYNKPEGEVTTHEDPEGRPTIFEKLPRLKGSRWVSVGRLDINTTGLLLVTTDGELANALMHPSHEVEREYICRIYGQVTEDMLEQLKKGVELEDGIAHFDDIAVVNLGDNHSWFRVVLREGRNREVRRLWESQGVQVNRLKRIRYGNIELQRELRRGHYQALPIEKCRELRTSLGLTDVPQVLTLQPLIGVRKASKNNEYKGNELTQEAWSGSNADEARELRAFDFVRDERAPQKRRRHSRNQPRPSGSRSATQDKPIDTDRRRQDKRSPRRPEGSFQNARPRSDRNEGSFQNARPRSDRPEGSFQNARPRSDRNEGNFHNARPRSDRNEGNFQNARPRSDRNDPNGNPAALRSWSPGQRPRNEANRNPKNPMGASGAGAPRRNKPVMPYGFPSDHAYARRHLDEANGNQSPMNAPNSPNRGRRHRRKPRPTV